MSGIFAVLTHRCGIQRTKATYADGSPSYSYEAVSTGTRCLLTMLETEGIQSSEIHPAIAPQKGVLFLAPTANVQPGDIVTMAEPMWGRYRVTAEIFPVVNGTGHTLSHLVAKVESIPEKAKVSAP